MSAGTQVNGVRVVRVRLRLTSCRQTGWTRRRRGSGFTYLDATGRRLDPDHVGRIRGLAIPPAWKDVWICPYPNGHLQAVGTDAAGRRQYLYHPSWRIKRDEAKFARVLGAAERLPQARRRILDDLASPGMPVEKACAVAVRLLDLGYFRIGSDAYADAHGSFGLTTLERRHVRQGRDGLVFAFTGKSGVGHRIVIDDPVVLTAIQPMRRRRDDSPRLLAYRGARGWADLDAGTVNAYLADLLGGEMTAKDFRTWHATVLAAAALAVAEEPGLTAASRKRAVRAAVVEVAAYLGNTPAIAKNSYIDPRVPEAYENGVTIDPRVVLADEPPDIKQAHLEKHVLDLLTGGPHATP